MTFRLSVSRELVMPVMLDAGYTLNLQSRTVQDRPWVKRKLGQLAPLALLSVAYTWSSNSCTSTHLTPCFPAFHTPYTPPQCSPRGRTSPTPCSSRRHGVGCPVSLSQ